MEKLKSDELGDVIADYHTKTSGEFPKEDSGTILKKWANDHKSYNIGKSNYADFKIQPWDIWREYKLDPWDADIVKRVLRTKDGDDPALDYKKIKHICDEKIRQLEGGYDEI